MSIDTATYWMSMDVTLSLNTFDKLGQEDGVIMGNDIKLKSVMVYNSEEKISKQTIVSQKLDEVINTGNPFTIRVDVNGQIDFSIASISNLKINNNTPQEYNLVRWSEPETGIISLTIQYDDILIPAFENPEISFALSTTGIPVF